MKVNAIFIGWVITIVLSIGGSWSAMNTRMYEVEARIRLIESQKSDKVDISEIKQSLIRIEGKLDLKQDRFK